MLGKMASYEEELLLQKIIAQARIVRDTYTFQHRVVLDDHRNMIPHRNATELYELNSLLISLDELRAID